MLQYIGRKEIAHNWLVLGKLSFYLFQHRDSNENSHSKMMKQDQIRN